MGKYWYAFLGLVYLLAESSCLGLFVWYSTNENQSLTFAVMVLYLIRIYDFVLLKIRLIKLESTIRVYENAIMKVAAEYILPK